MTTPRHRPGIHQCRHCFIVPLNVLSRFANDTTLDADTRAKMRGTFLETSRLRVMREAGRTMSLMHRSSIAPPAAAGPAAVPAEQLFDCHHKASLPGAAIPQPKTSADMAVSTVYSVTASVADFYESVLGRNSVDGQGMDLVSSIHYRTHFDNAFWNGQQMVYGDGDGKVFTEFYNSPDVIGHELTHGVTQNESGLQYDGESGALNESISDVFGAVFNQWLNKWPSTNATGWLIGAGIMGPKATSAGRTCLRDMIDPGASHCLSPQPDSYASFDPTADVHDNSGIPNKAFATFARSVGGEAWGNPIKVWYRACTDRRLKSSATFVDFARLTIEAAQTVGGQTLSDKAGAAWEAVQLPMVAVV
jgi:Zn-dependent metalloprotease